LEAPQKGADFAEFSQPNLRVFQAAGHYAMQVMVRGSKHQAEIMDIPDAPDFIIYISLVYFHLQIITKSDILRQVHGENSLLGNYMLYPLFNNRISSRFYRYWLYWG